LGLVSGFIFIEIIEAFTMEVNALRDQDRNGAKLCDCCYKMSRDAMIGTLQLSQGSVCRVACCRHSTESNRLHFDPIMDELVRLEAQCEIIF